MSLTHIHCIIVYIHVKFLVNKCQKMYRTKENFPDRDIIGAKYWKDRTPNTIMYTHFKLTLQIAHTFLKKTEFSRFELN